MQSLSSSATITLPWDLPYIDTIKNASPRLQDLVIWANLPRRPAHLLRYHGLRSWQEADYAFGDLSILVELATHGLSPKVSTLYLQNIFDMDQERGEGLLESLCSFLRPTALCLECMPLSPCLTWLHSLRYDTLSSVKTLEIDAWLPEEGRGFVIDEVVAAIVSLLPKSSFQHLSLRFFMYRLDSQGYLEANTASGGLANENPELLEQIFEQMRLAILHTSSLREIVLSLHESTTPKTAVKHTLYHPFLGSQSITSVSLTPEELLNWRQGLLGELPIRSAELGLKRLRNKLHEDQESVDMFLHGNSSLEDRMNRSQFQCTEEDIWGR